MAPQKNRHLASLFRAVRRYLRKMRLKDRDSPIFVQATAVDTAFRLPTEFNEKEFAGLTLLMLLEAKTKDGAPCILMFWENEAFFRAELQRLQTVLALNLSASREFYVTDGRQQPSSPRFWAKIGVLVTGLALLATICANLEQISKTGQGLFNGFFAAARMEFVPVQEPSVKAIEGEKKTLDIECRNLGSAPCAFTLLPVTLENGDKSLLLDNNKRSFPPVDVAGTRPFSISLIPKGSFVHTITVAGRAKATWFWWGEKQISPEVFSVEVWPPVDTAPSVRFEGSYRDGIVGTFIIIAHHGRSPATGIAYQATLSPAEGARIIEVQLEGQPIQSEPQSGNDPKIQTHNRIRETKK
jgi:hypothetical protein